MKKNQCNHALGYIESERYEGIDVDFIYLSDAYLDNLKALTKEGRYAFCPNCGHSLEGVIESKISEIEKEISERKEQERIAKEKADKIFSDKMEKFGKESKLDQLPENENFIVIYEPMKSTYGKYYVIQGDKKHIIKCAVSHNHQRYEPETLVLHKIYKVFSQEQFGKIVESCGFSRKNEKSVFYIKKEGNKTTEVEMSESGTVYATITVVDEDGEEGRSYVPAFGIHRLSEFLKVPVELQEINL